MDESRYLDLAQRAFARVEDAFDDVDPDQVDCERSGDVLTLAFADGGKCILNTQRPTRQLWLAASARAWHFSYDEAAGEWRDDKDASTELFATIARVVRERTGLAVEM